MDTRVELTAPELPINDLPIEELLKVLNHIQKLIEIKTATIAPTTNDTNRESTTVDVEMEFQNPKKTQKRKQETEETVFAVSNKYQVLSKATDNTDEDLNFPPLKKLGSQASKKSEKLQKPKTTANVQPHIEKAPPIVIRDKSKWTFVSSEITKNKLNYTKAISTSKGIKVEPCTVDDYKNMIRLLRDTLKVQYHTFDLNSEKPLKVVLRGVIPEITDEEIQSDLITKGYPITKISRMMGRNNQPAPLVLIEIERDYKSIYNLSNCCGLSITAEPLKTKTTVIQCHRCQMFGHAQKNCNAEYKCLKCGDGHSTHLCPKPRTTPAKCANCAGEHPANYSKCSENPNSNPQLEKPKTTKPWTTSKTEPSTSTTHPIAPISPSSTTKQPEPRETKELSLLIGDMFLNFSNTNATQEQKMLFIDQTQNLIKLFTARK